MWTGNYNFADQSSPHSPNFSRINVDRQLQPKEQPSTSALYFSRINVDRQLQQCVPRTEQGTTLAGSMWTGNYNCTDGHTSNASTLAGSMWTGNYNRPSTVSGTASTLAGSMWTGNYNGVAGGRRRGAERRRRGVRHQPEKSALGRGWGARGEGEHLSREQRGSPSPRISTNLPQAAQLLDALRRRG